MLALGIQASTGQLWQGMAGGWTPCFMHLLLRFPWHSFGNGGDPLWSSVTFYRAQAYGLKNGPDALISQNSPD